MDREPPSLARDPLPSYRDPLPYDSEQAVRILLECILNRGLFVSLLGRATSHHGSVKNLLEFAGESCDRCSPILCGTAEKRNCGEGRTNESHTILIPSKLGPTRLWMTSSYQFLEAAGFLPACSRSGEGYLPTQGPDPFPYCTRIPPPLTMCPSPPPIKTSIFRRCDYKLYHKKVTKF